MFLWDKHSEQTCISCKACVHCVQKIGKTELFTKRQHINHMYWCNDPFKHSKLLQWHVIPTFIVGYTVHIAALHIAQKWFSYLFLVNQIMSGSLWADVDMHVFVSVLNWIKCKGESAGGLLLEWAGLMCSQQTASDPSSACLNWAPGFIQCRVYLQYSALYKSLLHRRPLQRGHCSSFVHTRVHARREHEHTQTHKHDTYCCWADLCRGLN